MPRPPRHLRRVAPLAAAALTAAAGASAASAPSLQISDRFVSYGDAVVLSGGGAAPGRVELLAQPCGFSAPAEMAKTKVRGGAFRFELSPAITTVFQASSDDARSRRVKVSVRPAVSLRQVGARRYEADVSAGAGSFFVGKRVLLQTKVHGRWKTVRRSRLRAASSPTAITAVSSARFATRVPAGSSLRALIPGVEAAPCFAGAASVPLRS